MLDIEEFAERFFEIPEPPLKKRWVREYEDITVHTQGRVASRLIEERRPYEDKDIQKYRRKNYEPVTKGPFSRAKTNLSRVFSGAQVVVKVDDDVVSDYIAGLNFEGVDLQSYWSRKLCSRMIEDANGLIVWWVDEVPPPNERVKPVPYLILCKNIRHLTDEVLTWKSNERSPVSVEDEKTGRKRLVEAGDVYYIVTTDAYWKLVQVGDLSAKRFELQPHYHHGLGTLPVFVLGGEEVSMPNEKTNVDDVWFSSFFASAIPFANECARQFSDHQGVLVTSGYPMKEVAPVKCMEPGCVDGQIRKVADNGEVTFTTCGRCHGRGKVPPFSPYGVLIREERSALSTESSSVDVPMVRFLSPDPSILEFGGKTWREYLKDVERELNLVFVDEAQSGVAKEIDREDKVAKLDKIGHHLFRGLMLQSIFVIGRLMGARLEPEDVTVSLPPTFIVRTESDLAGEMRLMRDGDAPSVLVGSIAAEYARKRFPGDRTIGTMLDILVAYDPLFSKSAEEVATAVSVGVVDRTMQRRHLLAYTALQRLVFNEGAGVLFDDDIFNRLDDTIEEMMPAARFGLDFLRGGNDDPEGD